MKANRTHEKVFPHYLVDRPSTLPILGLTACVALASLLPVLDNADMVC